MTSDSQPGELRSGMVLAASPALKDPHFRETLVYLAEHNEHGSMGFILNRPTGQRLLDILRDQADVDTLLHDIPVHFGGPVKPQELFLVLFRRGSTEEELQCDLNVPMEQVHAHLANGTGWVRGFMGYSGWGEGQLENEMSGQAWIVRRPHQILMSRNSSPMMWSVFIGKDQRWRSLAQHLPEDPLQN